MALVKNNRIEPAGIQKDSLPVRMAGVYLPENQSKSFPERDPLAYPTQQDITPIAFCRYGAENKIDISLRFGT